MDKWYGFITGLVIGVGLTIMWYPTIARWWAERKMPYRAICHLCKNGNKYRVMSSNITDLDRMMSVHKEKVHAD